MIVAAADGSSLDNPGPAGWAWYIDDDTWAAGGWPRGTNNMGELMAVLDLLRSTGGLGEPLTILCDSQYAINCCTKWMPGWKRKGWRKADGKPVLNRDLLEQIDVQLRGRDVTFEWVKGHAGHALNEAADVRARAAATAFRDGTPVNRGPGFGGVARAPEPQEDVPTPGRSVEQEELFHLPERPASPDQELIGIFTDKERRLLETDAVAHRRALEELAAPDFVEHDANGRLWTRGRALADMPAPEVSASIEVLGMVRTGPQDVLLRWRARAGSRVSLRVSLWHRDAERGWQLRFRQITSVR
ncbi:ribonuclease H family protein [Cutibacterium avidum]|uniref:ribonuclease H family protein n=1 Tax=Cutibacterium avidum TaxID=33010 RepID=UPI0008F5937F|nr:ribonuclease H [Cutibacterium avidum]MDK7699185.1 ribonuclease H [Cutibacterium avidum]OIJ76647.1 ribonuclease HI [Cutibacterium avidum]